MPRGASAAVRVRASSRMSRGWSRQQGPRSRLKMGLREARRHLLRALIEDAVAAVLHREERRVRHPVVASERVQLAAVILTEAP